MATAVADRDAGRPAALARVPGRPARGGRQDQQWLLGRDVLVAPVVHDGAREREVYFPRGCWKGRPGERFEGPLTATVPAPLARLPYFIRCGANPF